MRARVGQFAGLAVLLLLGVLLKPSAVWWAALIIAAVVWVLASEQASGYLPRLSAEHGDGVALRLRLPARYRGRELRRRTAALVNDWHRYSATWQGGGRPEDHAAWEAAVQGAEHFFDVWGEVERAKDESVLRWRDECELVFRERIIELEAEYQRRGLLEADELTQFSEGQLPSERPYAEFGSMRPDPLLPVITRLEQLSGMASVGASG